MEAVANPGRRWFDSRATSEQGWCWPRKPQPAGTVPPRCLHADPALVLAALMAFLRRYELIVGIPEACGIPEFYQDAARLETEFNSAPKVDQWGRPVPPSAIDDVVAEPWFLEPSELELNQEEEVTSHEQEEQKEREQEELRQVVPL